MSEDRQQSLSDRDRELVLLLWKEAHADCVRLDDEQRAALPAMIAEYGERVAAERIRRQFWEELAMKGKAYALLLFVIFLVGCVLYGGKESASKVLHLMVESAAP